MTRAIELAPLAAHRKNFGWQKEAIYGGERCAQHTTRRRPHAQEHVRLRVGSLGTEGQPRHCAG